MMWLSGRAYGEWSRSGLMADRARLVELLGSRKWGLYRSGQKEYTTSFRSLLPKGRKDFKEVADNIFKAQGHCRVLDVGGEGEFIRTLGNAEGAAITLTDQRSTYMDPTKDDNNHILLIEGEMLAHSPWAKAKEFLLERNPSAQGFDLVIARPMFGWSLTPKEGEYYGPELQYVVLSRMWNLLTPGRSMYAELPVPESDYLNKWMPLLQTGGIRVFSGYNPQVEGKPRQVLGLRLDKPLNWVGSLPKSNR